MPRGPGGTAACAVYRGCMVARGRRYRRRVNRFNRVLVGLQKAGLKLGAVQTLTTTGRRTGQPRRVPVGLVERDGQRYLVQAYPNAARVANVRRTTPPISVTAGIRTRSGSLRCQWRTAVNCCFNTCRTARREPESSSSRRDCGQSQPGRHCRRCRTDRCVPHRISLTSGKAAAGAAIVLDLRFQYHHVDLGRSTLSQRDVPLICPS